MNPQIQKRTPEVVYYVYSHGTTHRHPYMLGDQHHWKMVNPYSDAPKVTRIVVDQGVPSVGVAVTHDPNNPFEIDRRLG